MAAPRQGRAPQFDTVAIPKRIQLVSTLEQRDGTFTKDAQLVNCFAERDPSDGEYWVEKRPGYGTRLVTMPVSGVNVGRGLYKFVTAGSSFVFLGVNNNRLSRVDSGVTVPVLLGNVASGLNQFVWETILSSPRTAVLNDGANAYWTNNAIVTDMSTFANFPIGIVKGWAYLDGTLYVMDRNNIIHGSNINDATTWSALNVIVANNGSDFAVCLVKHKNYVAAMKSASIEFFFDNQNPAGSPLSPVLGSKINYGCFSADTVQDIDGELFWVTSSDTAGFQVGRLTNLQISIASNSAVDKLLRGYTVSDTIDAGVVKLSGHKFYVLSFRSTKLMTLIFDVTEGLWYHWSNVDGTLPYLVNVTSGPDDLGRTICQIYNSGALHEIGEDYKFTTDDNLNPATVDIYTQDHDFGTQRSKQLGAIYFRGDQVTGSVLQLRYSDQDYMNWSNFTDIDLGAIRPAITDQGSFYDRAWNFRHKCPTPFRIKTTDLQLDIGTV